MLKVTLWHTPQHFQFYIQDPDAGFHSISEHTFDELEQQRFSVAKRSAMIGVKSEINPIPITVEFDREELTTNDLEKWDRIVEFTLSTRSSKIVFAGCPGGATDGCFGELEVNPGRYRVRVHYGGQDEVEDEGTTGDFYLVQIWPKSQL